MKIRPLVLVALATLLGNAACGGGSDDAPPDAAQHVDFRVSTEALVTAAEGGTLRLPDGSTLTIPAGALASDTRITFAALAEQKPGDRGRYFEVTPSMQLLKPATLTTAAPEGVTDQSMVWAYDSSMSSPLVDRGSESTRWRPAKLVPSAPGTVAIETAHFTGFAILHSLQDSGYLVVDVPAKYLEPGDILITLSGEHPVGDTPGPNWFPGHVGVFVGPDAFQPGETIVGPNGVQLNGSPDIVESVKAGVKNGSVDWFRSGFASDHLYLGPRRVGLTADEKKKVVDRTMSQRGKGYNLVGDASKFLSTVVGMATLDQLDPLRVGGVSCVGLADDALASAGKSPVSGVDRHLIAVTPIDMYHATGPVTTMTAVEGDDISIPIYGAVVDPRSRTGGITHSLDGFYTKQRSATSGAASSSYSIDVKGLPADASFTPNAEGYVFHWKAGYAGSPVHLHFTMTYTSQATDGDGKAVNVGGPTKIEQDLTIYVRPFSLGPIRAYFNPSTFSTTYTLQVENPTKEFVNVTWSGPNCGTYAPMGLGPDSMDEHVVQTMTWSHPHPPCDPTTQHADVKITALVHTKFGSATCTYQGAESGLGPACKYQ
jgi:hypothetical protein